MVTTHHVASRGDWRDPDQRVFLYDVSWELYEAILSSRGEAAGPRFYYLDGTLEITTTSRSHERIAKNLARLLEAYAEEAEIRFDGYKSETMRSAPRKRGAEPDECYVVQGGAEDRPGIVIEVTWTSGSLDKREIYAGLGIRELWEWEDGRILIHTLRDGVYEPIERSELLPDVDLRTLELFAQAEDQTAAVRAYRKLLRAKP